MNDLHWLWMIAPGAVAFYCLVQTVAHIRNKQYAWALAAAISAAVLLTMPIKSHVVKIDLPASR